MQIRMIAELETFYRDASQNVRECSRLYRYERWVGAMATWELAKPELMFGDHRRVRA